MWSLWIIKKVSEGYLVTSKNKGSFIVNNKKSAEILCTKLEKNEIVIGSLCDTIIEAGEDLIELGESIKKENGVE